MKVRRIEKKRPAVCLSLACKTVDELKEEFAQNKNYCQMVEWCIEKTEGSENYSEEEFKAILKDIKKMCGLKKLIVSYKGDVSVGGRILAWSVGIANIIDVDADNPCLPAVVKATRFSRSKVLISHHRYDEMPSRDDIAEQFIKMEKLGGDILKIACFAKEEIDTHQMLEGAAAYVQLRKAKPIVAIAMGENGQTSRVCAGDFGSVISYAYGSEPTAPGQFSAKDLSKYLDVYYGEK